MNWEALGAIGETVGAVGVIATMAFLAYQIIQTRTALRANAYQAYSHDKRELVMFLVSDPIRGTMIEGLQNPDSLDQDSLFAFQQAMVNFMFFFQMSHKMWRSKQITDADWVTDKQLIGELKSTPGFEIWWPQCRNFFEAEFADAVDDTDPVSRDGFREVPQRFGSRTMMFTHKPMGIR